MIDLMIKMALCLVVALILGFIIGWLLSKVSTKKRCNKEITQIEKKLLKSEDAVKKLKEINLTQKEEINRTKAKNRGFKYNQALIEKNSELIALCEQKEEEIRGFEKVLIKAEEMIDERNQKIILFEKGKKRKKEEKCDNEYEELLITKDQFSHIETQLLEYQKEISQLKEQNRRLKLHHKDKFSLEKEPENQEERTELDDSTIIKLFGNTYKKIIKS